MESRRNKSVTLIELIIAIILVAVIILGINSIDIFSRYHLISSDRRAKVQNDLSRSIEHMTKEISKAIGNEVVFTSNSVVWITGNNTLDIFTDANGNGMRDIAGSAPKDKWIRYKLNSANPQLEYYADCTDALAPSCPGTPDEILAKNITAFSVPTCCSSPPTSACPCHFTNGKLTDNYLDVSMTSCFDPTRACGTQDNPSVTMSTTINMPSVSTN